MNAEKNGIPKTAQEGVNQILEAIGQNAGLLENVFSNKYMGIAYLDREFNFLLVNQTYAEFDGKTPEYYVGKNHFQLYPNEENEGIFRNTLKTGEPYFAFSKPFVYEHNPERGVTYWDWTLQPVRNRDGSIIGLFFTLINVTERVIADRTVQESQVLFRHLFQLAPDANVLTDERGRIIAVNQKTEELFGYSGKELSGKPIETLIPDRYTERHQSHRSRYIREAQSQPMSVNLEMYGQHKTGYEFPTEVTLSLLKTNGSLSILSVIRDISDRKQVEKNLREQTQLVKLLQEIAVASNQAGTVENAFQFAIDRICEHTGWQVGHVFLSIGGKHLVSTGLWHMDDASRDNIFRQATDKITFGTGVGIPGRILETQKPILVTDIDEDPYFVRTEAARQTGLKSVFAFPILSGAEIVGVLEFYSEKSVNPSQPFLETLPNIGAQLGRVVERKRLEEKQKEQEVLLRTVLETLPVGVWVADQAGNLVMGNKAEQEIWSGADSKPLPPNFKRRGWWEFNSEPIAPDDWPLYRAVTYGESTINQEIIIQCQDGSRKTILNSAFPLLDANRKVGGAIVVDQDITQRKQMEVELAEVQRRLLDGIEAERLRLAQDLHDGPIQDLYGVMFQIRELQDELQASEQIHLIRATQLTLHDVISALRTTMGELRPPTLTPFGLEKAIRSHVDRFQGEHPEMNIHLDLESDGKSLPEHVRLALFRNYQQLLSNVVRHADAHNLWIRLQLSSDQIVLEIQDDGLGFTAPQRWVELARRGHLGLVGASERAEALGGKLEIEAIPGEGSLIRTIIPRTF